jgi:hypothetical protein
MKKKAKLDAGTTAGAAGTDVDAYTYLRKVWNDEMQPEHNRLKAATVGIEYERPRLAVQATVTGQDFASLLDARLKRHGMKLIEGKAIPIEAKQNGDDGLKQNGDGLKRKTDLTLAPMVPDRRFRRRA